MPHRPPTREKRFHEGVNVVGYLSASNGVGHAARGYAQSLQHLGVPISQLDLVPHKKGTASTNNEHQPEVLHKVSLIVTNPVPTEAYHLVRHVGIDTLRRSYNI